jgi:hypothetical protein
MKNFFYPLAFMVCFASCKNNSGNKAAGNQHDSYQFDVPKGWTSERIPFPVSFAASIPYTGVEDLRFTSGWADPASDEYWSYEFVWWLQGSPVINADILQQNMRIYYTGLVTDNITRRNIPANKIIPVNTNFKKINAAPGDIETYSGSISMLDYMIQRPIILNSLVHIKKCTTPNHTVVLFEMSPKPFEHMTWQQLNKLQMSFKCDN